MDMLISTKIQFRLSSLTPFVFRVTFLQSVQIWVQAIGIKWRPMLDFLKLPLKTYLNTVLETNGHIKYNKRQIVQTKIKILLIFLKTCIIFHNLRGKSEIFLKTPQV